jgi:type I restriction enzyme S subunit
MKYVYYILSNNEKLDKLKTGVGIPNITKGTLENLKIPVPSIERQQEIVAYCESNDALIRQLEMEIENNKKQAQLFIDGVVKLASSKNDQHHDDDQGHQNHDEHDDDHDAVEGEAPDTSANVVVSIASIEETTTTAISQNGPKIRKIIIKKSAANS